MNSQQEAEFRLAVTYFRNAGESWRKLMEELKDSYALDAAAFQRAAESTELNDTDRAAMAERERATRHKVRILCEVLGQ